MNEQMCRPRYISAGRSNASRNSNGRRNGNGAAEQHNNYQIVEKIFIPPNRIGKIIGRGGSNIREIQAKFQVLLNLDRSSGILTIQGITRQDVNETKNLVIKQLYDGSFNKQERTDTNGTASATRPQSGDIRERGGGSRSNNWNTNTRQMVSKLFIIFSIKTN